MGLNMIISDVSPFALYILIENFEISHLWRTYFFSHGIDHVPKFVCVEAFSRTVIVYSFFSTILDQSNSPPPPFLSLSLCVCVCVKRAHTHTGTHINRPID